jgi:hypothetical protein
MRNELSASCTYALVFYLNTHQIKIRIQNINVLCYELVTLIGCGNSLTVAPLTHNSSISNHALTVPNIITVQAVRALNNLIYKAVKYSCTGRANAT